MTVREMIGLDEAALNAELDAAISRVKKLNNNVDEMGDNRADSKDSREFGPVKVKNIASKIYK